MLDDSVTQTVEGLLSGDSDNLTPLTTQYNLVLEDVVSVASFGASTEGKWFICNCFVCFCHDVCSRDLN